MDVEMIGESLAVAGTEPAFRPTKKRKTPWGTWEELVLGGAVLRHGTTGWTPVAAELRLRFPYPFTPQECEAKYKDVLELFSGVDAWFEELRRRRIEELRRELENSEDSIGSLQLKLENLKAEGESDQSTDRNPGHTELLYGPYPIMNAEGTDLSSKEPCNDRSSAGSFIEETRSTWSPEPQIADSGCGQDTSVEDSKNSLLVFGMRQDGGMVPVSLRRKRGARKRRFQNDPNEGSNDMNNSACSLGVNKAEAKASSSQHTGPSKQGAHSEEPAQNSVHDCQDLEGMVDAVMKHKGVSLFCRQLDSQKKARYRKMIRRHVDLETIKSRIKAGLISSTGEVLRDLLLLSNNTLVFYPKHTGEHKAALVLRGLVSTKLRADRSSRKISDVAGNADAKNVIKPEAGKTGGDVRKPGGMTAINKKGKSPKKVVCAEHDLGASPPIKRRRGRPAKNTSQQLPKESPLKGRKTRR